MNSYLKKNTEKKYERTECECGVHDVEGTFANVHYVHVRLVQYALLSNTREMEIGDRT